MDELKTKEYQQMEILSFADLFFVIRTNLKKLITIAFATIIGSSVIALILPVYFTSTTVIFPVKLAQAPVNETAFRRGNISDFGETGEAEQALEILNSTSLMDRIIYKYDLFQHYELDTSQTAALTFVRKTYQGNVNIKRTKFNSIQITVRDKDPVMAAQMANSIAAYLDTIKYEMVKSRANELVSNLEVQHARQKSLIDSLQKHIELLTQKGIMSQFQRGYLLEAYGQSSGRERSELKPIVDANITYGEEFDRIEKIYDREMDNLLLINKYLVQTKADGEIQFSQKFIVDLAEPAEKKSYPVRWLFVLVSLCSAMFISVFLLLFKLKWPIIKSRLS